MHHMKTINYLVRVAASLALAYGLASALAGCAADTGDSAKVEASPSTAPVSCNWGMFVACPVPGSGDTALGLRCDAPDGEQTLNVPAAPPYQTKASCYHECCRLGL